MMLFTSVGSPNLASEIPALGVLTHVLKLHIFLQPGMLEQLLGKQAVCQCFGGCVREVSEDVQKMHGSLLCFAPRIAPHLNTANVS
jgi:hypothetical protein